MTDSTTDTAGSTPGLKARLRVDLTTGAAHLDWKSPAGGGTTVETLFYPAVLFPVKEGMKLYREEQFGPIIPVAGPIGTAGTGRRRASCRP